MESNSIAVARRWFDEVWNQRREATIHELLGPDSLCQTDEGPITGAEEFLERLYRPFTAAFPDLRIEVLGAVAEGDQVVVRWAASGVHSGTGMAAPTGRRLEFRGMTWLVIRGGKLCEGWQHSNIPEVVRGLVASPMP